MRAIKMKKYNSVFKEGTWALKDAKSCDDFIKEIMKLKNKYYGLVGDDILFDHFDDAIDRIKELKIAKVKANQLGTR
jgi:hypothetical protein